MVLFLAWNFHSIQNKVSYQNVKTTLSIGTDGVYLNEKLVTTISNGDIDPEARSQGADYQIFSALDRIVTSNESNNLKQNHILNVEIDPSTSFNIVRRELLAAQQSEFWVFALKPSTKNCGTNIRLFIPFLTCPFNCVEHAPIQLIQIELKDEIWSINSRRVRTHQGENFAEYISTEETKKGYNIASSSHGKYSATKDLVSAFNKILVNKKDTGKVTRIDLNAAMSVKWQTIESFLCEMRSDSLLKSFAHPLEYQEDRLKGPAERLVLSGVML